MNADTKWLQYTLTGLIAALLGWGASFVTSTYGTETRVAVLESQRQAIEARLDKIDSKLDQLLLRTENSHRVPNGL